MPLKRHENIFKSTIVAERGKLMFTNPIKHTRFNTIGEVYRFSYKTNGRTEPFSYFEKKGNIAFSDANGEIHVTPFRSEIKGLLNSEGYKNTPMYVPFCGDEDEPDAYSWLRAIADEENWAETYETAFKLSSARGIKYVKLNTQKLQIKEILYCYDDVANHRKYERMIMQFFTYNTKDNIATYIFVDEKTVLICDEYGRTFLVKAKTVINDVINALIDAGYTRTTHPEKYVHTLIEPF